MQNILGRAHNEHGTVEVSITGDNLMDVANTTEYKRDFKFCITIWLPDGAEIIDSKDIVLEAIERESMSSIPETERVQLDKLWEKGLTTNESFEIAASCLKLLSENHFAVALMWSDIMNFFNEEMNLENPLYEEDNES